MKLIVLVSGARGATDIVVSNQTVRQDAANGLVAYLYAVGGSEPHTFSITSDPSSVFNIQNGNELHKVGSFPSSADYSITIQADGVYSEPVLIDVIPTATAPPDVPPNPDLTVLPDPNDPEYNDDGFESAPVTAETEEGVAVSGKNAGTTTFLLNWGVPVADNTYTMRYSADYSGMSANGRYAAVGFGFKSGNDFHIVGLRGSGTQPTTMRVSRVYGDFRKAKNFTVTNDALATNGTKDGPNWLRIVIALDGTTYDLLSSADGETWTLERNDTLPQPLSTSSSALQFGPAAYFAAQDQGPFVINIDRFINTSKFIGAKVTLTADNAGNHSAGTIVPWTAEEYDLGGWHSTVTNTTRLTVPYGYGITRIRLSGSAWSTNMFARTYLWIRKNGSTTFDQFVASMNTAYAGTAFATQEWSIETLSIPAVPGDYFEFVCSHPGDTATTILANYSFFAIEATHRTGDPAWVGANVKLSANVTGVNGTTSPVVAWTAETLDTGGWHDNVTNNSRLTVPSGYNISAVRLSVSLRCTGLSAHYIVTLWKNGSTAVAEQRIHETIGGGDVICHFVTADLAAVAGDYFHVSMYSASTNLTMQSTDHTKFQIEAVEFEGVA
jgi:hypothetical protein